MVDSWREDPLQYWAVVPVKTLSQAKSRLSKALTPSDRHRLVLALLVRTLQVLGDIEELARVAVVSRDPNVWAVARARRATALREPGPEGLNAALSWAAARIIERGGGGLLVIPVDLPLLTVESVRQLLKLATAPGMVIAPDRSGQGTNALIVVPPDLIPFRYGVHPAGTGPDSGSFERHLALARAAGVIPRVLRCDDLAQDLDQPDDLSLVTDRI